MHQESLFSMTTKVYIFFKSLNNENIIAMFTSTVCTSNNLFLALLVMLLQYPLAIAFGTFITKFLHWKKFVIYTQTTAI